MESQQALMEQRGNDLKWAETNEEGLTIDTKNQGEHRCEQSRSDLKGKNHQATKKLDNLNRWEFSE